MINSRYIDDVAYKRGLFLLLILLFALPMRSIQAQENPIDKVIVEITCVDADGAEVNAGLGKLTVNADPVVVLKDDATAADCVSLGAQVLLSQLDEATITRLLDDRVAVDVATGTASPESTDNSEETGASSEENTVKIIGAEPTIVELGTPVEPAANYTRECDNNRLTDNAVRIRASLPAGDYRAVLLPVRFQTFDPIMFIDTGARRVCNADSNLAREYVVDFSRAGIGSQVYGHNSGSVIEFSVAEDATQPVEIIFGGQANSSAGKSGEFVLILEGARLTPQVNQHIYNVTMTDSLFSSDTPFSVIALGVDDVMNPNLKAGVFIDDVFNQLFECEDSGGACNSDNQQTLRGTSIVEAGVRTVQGDDQDAVVVKPPGAYLAMGAQAVSFVVSEVQDDTLSREEYVIVFYGGLR